jgi:Na+-transporting NADH:ubiquinone oxidoreductase subunit NqrE
LRIPASTLDHLIFRILLTLVSLGIAAFTVLMATKVWPYLGFEYAIHFLGTKPDAVLQRPVFQWGFYVHITTSTVVMAAGIVQIWPYIARRWPVLHRYLGRVYAALILLLAAPSGLVLAVYANGGLSTQVGFALQCVVWWAFTAIAWWEIRQRQHLQHIEMMLRSLAITLAAFSLRSESYLMKSLLNTKPMETYLTVTWLSWVGNWMLIELAIYLGLGRVMYKKFIR